MSSSALLEELDLSKLPDHVAIIMDGNGRWAKKRGLPRIMGHKAGVETIKRIVRLSSDLGIKYLTLYAFSTENWKRPKDEVSFLMRLLIEYLNKELKELHDENVKVNAIGRISELPQAAYECLLNAMAYTSGNTGLVLNLALNYGGRMEIVDAVNNIIKDINDGKLQRNSSIDQNIFISYLYTASMPDPDLLIRTSGEMRISNFLLYQIAYTEMYFTDVYWPDFSDEEYLKALIDYQKRQRRYGAI